MAPFDERMAQAAAVADHARIRVTDIERRLGTVYTADTLKALLPRFPQCRFVWLMGADNLDQIWEWKDWQTIFSPHSDCSFRQAALLSFVYCRGRRRFVSLPGASRRQGLVIWQTCKHRLGCSSTIGRTPDRRRGSGPVAPPSGPRRRRRSAPARFPPCSQSQPRRPRSSSRMTRRWRKPTACFRW